MLSETVTLILAGRKGANLHPLTEHRALPAVPFGGKYRIIDFTLANCMHSGLRRILVLTQYKSLSLQKHIRDGWGIFNPELGEYITTVPPQMRTGESWYRGTADAIYQNLYLLERSGAKWILVLSGYHIYRMDYAALLRAHIENNAEVSIPFREASFAEATKANYALLKSDPLDRITKYELKPKNLKPDLNENKTLQLGMGIYLFSIELLMDAIKHNAEQGEDSHNLDRDVIPKLINNHAVYAYRFGGKYGRVSPDGYWGEMDSIDSYYQANMDLLEPIPPLDLYQADWQIRTYQEQSPPCRTVPGDEGSEGIFINSIASSGVVISGGSVQHSILFSNVFVDDQAMVEDSLVLNNVKIGKGVILRKCIIEKGVTIPDGESVGVDLAKDLMRFTVSEGGVVVVPKNYQFE